MNQAKILARRLNRASPTSAMLTEALGDTEGTSKPNLMRRATRTAYRPRKEARVREPRRSTPPGQGGRLGAPISMAWSTRSQRAGPS